MSLVLFVWTKKQLQNIQQDIYKSLHSNQLNSELTALNAGSIGLGARFIKLEKELHQLASRIDEMSSEVQSSSPYSYAISLAQKGDTAESIAELCHLSLTEAQLLVMMHQQNIAA